MESRKAIVKKLFYESGVKAGKRMFREIEALIKRWGSQCKNYNLRRDDNIKEYANIVHKSKLKLFNLLIKEVTLYAPKRIRNYMDKARIQTIDDATGKFNTYLKDLTYIYFEEPNGSYKGIIPPREAEDLLKTYNGLLDESIEEMRSDYPKGIATYLDRLCSKQDSIIDTFAEEAQDKAAEIYQNERSIDLRDSATLSIKTLHNVFYEIKSKAFHKLNTTASADKYNLYKPMGEEKFNRFILKCGSEDFFDGLFTEYDIEAVSDIYPFPIQTIPLINHSRDSAYAVKEAKKVITEYHKEEYFDNLFDK